jgi:hypothetical protein
LTTPWYITFRSLAIRDKNLARNGNKIAVLKSAERPQVIIPANSKVTLQYYMDKKVQYHYKCAFLQPTQNSVVPHDLHITPAVVDYDYKSTSAVPVQISNITTRIVAINARSLIGELQPVEMEATNICSISTEKDYFP